MPIEVAKREALPKSFLAATLAKRGFSVLLFQDYIFDKHGYIGPGIYIGKNCFKTEVPYDIKYYNNLKAQGISLLYLDEEGGVFGGSSVKGWKERIIQRVDPKSLSSNDCYMSWGTWQAEVFREHSKAKVIITGSPNFEICKKEYSESLKSVDDEITNGVKDYILINTRFAAANRSKGTGEIFGKNSSSSQLLPSNFVTSLYSMDYIYLGYFINLVRVISEEFKNIKIILRPHPAENHDIYKEIFQNYDNVTVCNDGNVATWLRRALVVIHNGCTTAIQAKFACIPIINYTPSFDTDIDNCGDVKIGLLDSVGHKAVSIREVVRFIKLTIEDKTKSEENDSVYNSINNLNSFEAIADLASTINLTAAVHSKIMLKRIGFHVNMRNFVNKLLHRKNIFDYCEFDRIPNYIAAASTHFKSKIVASKVSNGIYKIEGS